VDSLLVSIGLGGGRLKFFKPIFHRVQAVVQILNVLIDALL